MAWLRATLTPSLYPPAHANTHSHPQYELQQEAHTRQRRRPPAHRRSGAPSHRARHAHTAQRRRARTRTCTVSPKGVLMAWLDHSIALAKSKMVRACLGSYPPSRLVLEASSWQNKPAQHM